MHREREKIIFLKKMENTCTSKLKFLLYVFSGKLHEQQHKKSNVSVFDQLFSCAFMTRQLSQVGDEILKVNGHFFRTLSHQEAVTVLRWTQNFSMVLSRVGKVPHTSHESDNQAAKHLASKFGVLSDNSFVPTAATQRQLDGHDNLHQLKSNVALSLSKLKKKKKASRNLDKET